MFKTIPLIAGAALLFAGVAQAAAPESQADPESTTVAHKEAPAPTAGDDTKDVSGNRVTKETEQELHPDARPVYLNGGYFGDN